VFASLPLLQGAITGLPSAVEALLMCADLQGRELTPSDGPPPRLLGEVLVRDLESLSERGTIPAVHTMGALLAGDFYAAPSASERGADGDVRPVYPSESASAPDRSAPPRPLSLPPVPGTQAC
jgi:hypothetical protein